MNINPSKIINNLLKQSDMAALPGTINVKNRVLDFHIFDRNKLKQKLSTLPDSVKQSLIYQINEFDKAFKKFPSANTRDYSGMLRIAYAEDTAIGQEEMKDLQQERPELLETAKFVKEYGIQLPPEEKGRVGDKKIDKGIGSDFWLSMFGYAYQDLTSKGMQYHVSQKRNKVSRKIQENVTGKEYSGSINGVFQVVSTGRGYTFGIVNEEGTTFVFDQTVSSNNRTKAKFFNQPIIVNSSAVYVENDIVSMVGKQDIEEMIPQQFEKVYGLFADEGDGSFYIQKKKKYHNPGKPVIDKETGKKVERVIGDKIYLTQEQVYFLANKNTIGKMYRVTPEDQGEVFNESELASGYKYFYKIEDENTLQKINNPRTREEFYYSVNALKQLKDWLDGRSKRYTFDENGMPVQSDKTHTSLEGFILYMAGPDFTAGTNINSGTTIGNPQLAQYKDLPNDQVNPVGDSLETKRTTFVVVSKRVSVPRMMSSGRYYENKFNEKKIGNDPWREVRSGLSSLAEAVSEMKSIIAGDGNRIVEDDSGNLVNKEVLPQLSPQSRGVEKADKAFNEFLGKDPNKKQDILPVVDINNNNNINNNLDDDNNKDLNKNKDVKALNIINRIIRSSQ